MATITPDKFLDIAHTVWGKPEHAERLGTFALSRHLGVQERTMRRWVQGKYTIPSGIADLMYSLEKRHNARQKIGSRVNASSAQESARA